MTYVDERVARYALQLVQASRQHNAIDLGISPRGGIAFLKGQSVSIDGRSDLCHAARLAANFTSSLRSSFITERWRSCQHGDPFRLDETDDPTSACPNEEIAMKKKKLERLLRLLLFSAAYFLLLAYCVIFNNNAGWSLWFLLTLLLLLDAVFLLPPSRRFKSF